MELRARLAMRVAGRAGWRERLPPDGGSLSARHSVPAARGLDKSAGGRNRDERAWGGEAPGANEDATGLPFVGAAGKYLDLLLRSVGLSRQDTVYICNVLKCRPPANRNPLPDEIAACAPFLERQLELIAPRALLAVGSFAAQSLTGQEGTAMGRLRGAVHSYRGVPLVCTYHPAALLRNPKWTRAFWDDLQLLRHVMDGV